VPLGVLPGEPWRDGPVRARKGYPDEQILREARRKAKHQIFGRASWG
jgi:hypothetical protein